MGTIDEPDSSLQGVRVTGVLVRKLLRDLRTPWVVLALFLFCFQILFARVAPDILGKFESVGLCAALWLGTTIGVWLAGFVGAEAERHIDPAAFLPAQLNVGLFVFALGGMTMAISAAGRSRNRVLGLAVFAALVQFLVNVLGQLWSPMEPLRPLSLFYYFQPQPMILHADWYGESAVWMRLAVLAAVGAVGYLAALVIFSRRDVPAPL